MVSYQIRPIFHPALPLFLTGHLTVFSGKIWHVLCSNIRYILNSSNFSLMTCFDFAACEVIKTLQTISYMLCFHTFGGWGVYIYLNQV